MKKLAAALLAYGLMASIAFGQVPNAGSPMVPNGGGGGGSGGGIGPLSTACGVTGGPISSGSVTLGETTAETTVAGTSYTVLNTDGGMVKRFTNAAAVPVTFNSSSLTVQPGCNFVTLKADGAGGLTVTPSGVTIDGSASTIAVAQGKSLDVYADSSGGYHTLPGNGAAAVTPGGSSGNLQTNNGSGGFGAYAGVSGIAHQWISALTASGGATQSQPACADISNAGALCPVTPGTGVATAAAANLSAAGGLASTIASGTAALGTGAITSATCAGTVTVVAANVATTDVLTASFNGDPSAVTGYIPATAGMLTILAYPTSGNVNFKACNNTSSSITPGAITLNWRVAR